MRALILLLACSILYTTHLNADTTYIKVHFLYGSRPKKEFKDTESKWFGGIHGGHVGVEMDSNYIIDFLPSGQFHIIEHPKKPHSHFVSHSVAGFWSIFGADSGDVKRTTIVIPINDDQKEKLDSIRDAYLSATPYDYAFIGMRCAAAAYDILGQIGVTKNHGRFRTYTKIFYPKLLRRRLLHRAKNENWTVRTVAGSPTRVWEKD